MAGSRRRARRHRAQQRVGRQRLTARQFRAVADERLRDARTLLDEERWLGAVYLAGYAIECWLKARLTETYPSIVRQTEDALTSDDDKLIWRLCHKLHALDEMLGRIPGLRGAMEADSNAFQQFSRVASSWSVHLRYARNIEIADAVGMVNTVKELKSWLR